MLVKLSVSGLLGLFIFNGTPMAIEEPILWQCEAAGDQRSYIANDLDTLASTFDLQIYSGPHYETWVETVSLSRAEAVTTESGWIGQTTDGQELKVTALVDNLVFEVDNSRYGKAVGRCIRHTPFS